MRRIIQSFAAMAALVLVLVPLASQAAIVHEETGNRASCGTSRVAALRAVTLGEAVTWGPGEWNPPNSPYTARYTSQTWTTGDNYGPGGNWRAAGSGQFDYVDSTGTHGRCVSL